MTQYSAIENLTEQELLALYEDTIENSSILSDYYLSCDNGIYGYVSNSNGTYYCSSSYIAPGYRCFSTTSCSFCLLCGCNSSARTSTGIYCVNSQNLCRRTLYTIPGYATSICN